MTKSKWVVKIGSNILFSGGLNLIKSLAKQVYILQHVFNIDVIWITSGAVAMGREYLAKKNEDCGGLSKRALSTIGQLLVMNLYKTAFELEGLDCAQLLMSVESLSQNSGIERFKETLEELCVADIVPILNENDATIAGKISFGNNDMLSAKVASWIQADKLVLLTDTDGVYDSNPKVNPQAKKFSRISQISSKLLSQTKDTTGAERGTGGMYSKLVAAQEAAMKGIEVRIAKGDASSVLIKIAQDLEIGTAILNTCRSVNSHRLATVSPILG